MQKSSRLLTGASCLHFRVLEAAAIANSYAASKSPGGYGASWILLPIVTTYENTEVSWGEWACISILPVYNLYLDKQLENGDITRRDIFKQNMIAWHLLGAIAYFSLSGEDEDMAANDKNDIKMGLSPAKNGMQLSMHYQF